MKLQNKLIFSFLTISLVPLSLTALLSYSNIKEALVASEVISLENNSVTKENKINNFFDSFCNELSVVKERFVVRNDLPVISRLKDEPNQPEYIRSREIVDAQMQVLAREKDINSIIFSDLNGEVVYSTDPALEKQSINQLHSEEGMEVFEKSLVGIYLSDISMHPEDGRAHFLAGAPIYDFSGILAGVIILEIDAENFYLLAEDNFGETGEAVVARRISTAAGNYHSYKYNKDGDYALYLAPLRFDPEAAFRRVIKIGDSIGEPIQKAVSGETGSGIYTDYRGEVVLAVWRYLPENHLGLVVKMDKKELLEPARQMALALFVFSIVSVITILLLALMLARVISRPIVGLTDIAKKIGKGDLEVKFDERLTFSDDEIGVLAKTLAVSIANLKDVKQNLEDRVLLRTNELSLENKKLSEAKIAMANLLEDLNSEKEILFKEKTRNEAILTGIGDGVFVLDKEEKVILFNPVAEKISGFSAKEVIGKEYSKVLKLIFEDSGEINDKFIKDAMISGKIVKMANHTVLIKKDGGRVPVADSAASIKDKNGRIFGCVVVFRDVTREREIDKMKTEFVSVASHQLRTPLTGIKWFTELILKTKLSPKIKDYVNQIAISNERMVRLVGDLLNVSRIETGKKFEIILKEVDIISIVKNIIKEQLSAAEQKHISLVCSADAPRELFLQVDELKIRQVFQNLLSNAIKYSKEKALIAVGCQRKKSEVVFFVEDNGIGIPKHQQNQVFSKFFRAENVMIVHTDGTGLGLYIVKAIVEAHGGKVWFESEEGKGTTFFFSLPIK